MSASRFITRALRQPVAFRQPVSTKNRPYSSRPSSLMPFLGLVNSLIHLKSLTRSLATPVTSRYQDPVTKTSTLSNGLSVSTETIPGASTSTVGLWIDAGSRADARGASGTAHFLEVSLFPNG